MKVIGSFAVFIALLAAGISGASTSKPPITWQTLAWGGIGGFQRVPPCGSIYLACALVQSSSSPRHVTSEQFASSGSTGDRPLARRIAKIDYSRYVLVAAWSNQRPSGGDDIEIRSIEQRGRTLKVGAVINPCDTPWPDGKTHACISDVIFAYHLVLVSKTALTKPYPTTAIIERWVRPGRS